MRWVKIAILSTGIAFHQDSVWTDCKHYGWLENLQPLEVWNTVRTETLHSQESWTNRGTVCNNLMHAVSVRPFCHFRTNDDDSCTKDDDSRTKEVRKLHPSWWRREILGWREKLKKNGVRRGWRGKRYIDWWAMIIILIMHLTTLESAQGSCLYRSHSFRFVCQKIVPNTLPEVMRHTNTNDARLL